MKKVTAVLLGAALILGMAACGQTSSGTGSDSGSTKKENTKPSPQEIWVCVSEESTYSNEANPEGISVTVRITYDYNDHGDRIRTEEITTPDYVKPKITEKTYEYNSRGDVTRITSSDGSYTVYEYEYRGNNLLKKTVTKWSNSNASRPGSTDEYIYDADGNVQTSTSVTNLTYNFETIVVVNERDGDGRIVRATRRRTEEYFDGRKGSDTTSIATYTYDEHGNQLHYRIEGSRTWYTTDCENEYDAKGNLVSVTETLRSSGSDEASTVEKRYEYDAAGNNTVYKKSEPPHNGWDVYEYDSHGNKVKYYFIGTDNKITGVTTYTYMLLSDYLAGKAAS